MDGLKGDQRMSVDVGLRAVCRWLLVSRYARGYVNATVLRFKNADLEYAEIGGAPTLAPCGKRFTAKFLDLLRSRCWPASPWQAASRRGQRTRHMNSYVVALLFPEAAEMPPASCKRDFSWFQTVQIITEVKSRADLGVKNQLSVAFSKWMFHKRNKNENQLIPCGPTSSVKLSC